MSSRKDKDEVIVLSSSDSEGSSGGARERLAKRPKKNNVRPPSAKKKEIDVDVGDDDDDDKAKTTTPPSTAASPSFQRFDPLYRCGFFLSAVPKLEAEPGFGPAANAAADRGATLQELFSPGSGEILNALVSNFMVEPRWLFDASEFPSLRRVRRHLAVCLGDERVREETAACLREIEEESSMSSSAAAAAASSSSGGGEGGGAERKVKTTLTMPRTEAFGTHHSKFALFEVSSGMRLVVVTGNFLQHE